MPLPIYLALITFAPAGCAVLIAALGGAFGMLDARQAAGEGVRHIPLRPLALGLAVLGALIPAVGLLIFAPATEANSALWTTLFGGSVGQAAWFSAVYRLDGFGLYAALGIALIVAPLLLWMAWQHGAPPVGQDGTDAELADEGAREQDQDQGEDEAEDTAMARPMPPLAGAGAALPAALWGGLALALAAETAALTLVFSDNVLWMALAWVLLAALAWGLGEIGNPLDTLDWPGLALMLAGPVLWTLIFFIPAVGGKGDITIYPRLTDMMGRGTITPLHALALAFALALAAGAYPFLAWVRGRAALITPAGLAALALATMPAALFVGARLYSAAQDGTSAWQEIGKATPPITGGIFFTLIGAVTIAIAGLMALERRDSRALIAYLAVAQAGWGFVALGLGAPAGITGLVVLLATSTFGLGAMLAAIYAAGTLTSDLEPDAAGPRQFGTPVEPLRLAAWCVGALSVVGAPLCAGFVGRQLIAAGAIEARGLLIPLTALAWAGDVLLSLALLRATAPAFTALLGIQMGAAADPASIASDVVEGGHAAAIENTAAAANEDAEEDAEDEGANAKEMTTGEIPAPTRTPATTLVTRARVVALLGEAPAVILALLAIIVAVAPQFLLTIGAIPAVGALLQPAQINTVTVTRLGYAADGVQALPTLAWAAFVIFFALRVFLVPGGARQTRPIALAGTGSDTEIEPGAPVPTPILAPIPVATHQGTEASATEADIEAEDDSARELVGLPEPADAWADFAPAFRSAWTLPGAEWLVRGVEEGPEEAETEAEREDQSDAEAEAEADPEDLVARQADEAGEHASEDADEHASEDADEHASEDADEHASEDTAADDERGHDERGHDERAGQSPVNGSAAATPILTGDADAAAAAAADANAASIDGDKPSAVDAPAGPRPARSRKRGRTGDRS